VAFVVAATYIINSTSGNSTASLRTSPSTARSAGGGAGGPVDGTPSTAPSMSASPDVRGSVGNDPVVLPDGFHYYTDPQFAWRIAVPNGWVVSRDPSYPSMVYFDEPTTPKRRLGVDRSPTPKPDPVADWTDLERRRVNGNELPGYQRVKIEAVPGYYRAAADWVYTYNGTSGSRLQVCNRGFVVNDHLAHAIFWLTPQAQWTDNASNWNLIASSFVPGS
jgi:eukaryotic-like serine/threonine-protein kinase